MAVGSNFAGLALGPLISGLVAEYAPRPLQLPFLIYIGLVAITAVPSLRGTCMRLALALLLPSLALLIAAQAQGSMSLRMPAVRIP